MGGDSPLSETRSLDNQFDCEDVNEACLKEAKGKRLWKKVRYQLIEYHSLPGFLRDNEFILGYYRSEWPLKQVFLSIFSIHNETLNVWTHLIGFFLFLFLTIYTATKAPDLMDLSSLQRLSDMIRRADLHKIHPELLNCLPSLAFPSMDFLSSVSGNIRELLANCLPDRFSHANQTENSVLHGVTDDLMNLVAPLMNRSITRWPFFAFLGGAMFCLLASSTCHLLACHSARLSYIVLRCDYAGIAALITTSFYPPVYYSFMCNPFFRNLYLSFITVLGITTIIFSLLPFFQGPKFRVYRASLFFVMGVSGVVPLVHKLIVFRNQPEAIQTTGYEVLMGVLWDIKDVKTPLDQATQKHRSFGFVTFLEREDAAAAMDNMDGAELYGRVLTVNYALPEKIKGGEQGWAAQPIWADADTWFERQQQEEEMQRIQAENKAAMQAAEELHRKKLTQEREGEKEEEIEMKDDPMARAEAEALLQSD